MGCGKQVGCLILGIVIGIAITVVIGICIWIFGNSTGVTLYWTAVVKTSYLNSYNETTNNSCRGVFGRNSAIERAQGIVTLPKGDPQGCGPIPYNQNSSFPPWIALVKRGNCTFDEKILAAKRQGATAVVVYEADSNSTSHISHPQTSGAVVIMIPNFRGKEIVSLVQSGIKVSLMIEVGSAYED